MGGHAKVRADAKRVYYESTSALIFVVDSTDPTGPNLVYHHSVFEEEKAELWQTVRDEKLTCAKVLIFENFQDLPNALSVKQVAESLELWKFSELRPGLEWYVQGCAATTGKGLVDGLETGCVAEPGAREWGSKCNSGANPF